MKKVVPLIVALSSLLLILPGLWMIGKLAISFWFPEHWTGQKAGGIQPLLINAGALLLFGLQHSLLARKSAKDFLQKYFSPPIIRSFYVLTSGWALGIMGWVWHQHPHTLWELQPGLLYWGLLAVSAGGWLLVMLGAIAIDPLDLIGLRIPLNQATGRPMPAPQLKTPGLYKIVRHPLYLGFLIAFMATPVMTYDHLLFSMGMTIYVLIGIYFEERDLVNKFGEAYKNTNKKFPCLFLSLSLKRRKPDRNQPARLQPGRRPGGLRDGLRRP